jgi:HD superfamily phosphohydrolase
MNKKKIINDPVYGFITLPYDSIYDVIQHPWFQRLRRIQQLGLSNLVYPSAVHTRFQHTLGALHLMGLALEVLKSKKIIISDLECEAACLAILMHDIGHGPFSHALEKELAPVHHEEISSYIMNDLNKQLNGKLSLALKIFNNDYEKKYLHQLVSSQLDVDRLDYLNRDSFFTGVAEGVIGYDRIIKMLNVHEDNLVVEEKGIYSIEKFIVSRRLMYWQVYLHKTVVAAEQMLIKVIHRAKYLTSQGKEVFGSPSLKVFLDSKNISAKNIDEWLPMFMKLDDTDIYSALKVWQHHDDKILSYLSDGIINRKLFKVSFQSATFNTQIIKQEKEKTKKYFKLENDSDIDYYMVVNSTSNSAYNKQTGQIYIMQKGNTIKDIAYASDQLNISVLSAPVVKHFICSWKN